MYSHTHLFFFFRKILDGLYQRGFRTNTGFIDTGLLLTVWTKVGGYVVVFCTVSLFICFSIRTILIVSPFEKHDISFVESVGTKLRRT